MKKHYFLEHKELDKQCCHQMIYNQNKWGAATVIDYDYDDLVLVPPELHRKIVSSIEELNKRGVSLKKIGKTYGVYSGLRLALDKSKRISRYDGWHPCQRSTIRLILSITIEYLFLETAIQ